MKSLPEQIAIAILLIGVFAAGYYFGVSDTKNAFIAKKYYIEQRK